MDESGKNSQADTNVRTPLTRREFLIVGGRTAAALTAIAIGLQGDTLQSPEALRESTLIELDIFDTSKLGERLIKENFPERFSEEESLQDLGVKDASTYEGLKQGKPETEDQAKLLLLRFLELKFKDHGNNVSDVGKATEQILTGKVDSIPAIQISIVEAIEIKGLTYDELGNPILKYYISPDNINALLKNSSADLVNMSFQPGENELKYVMYEMNQKLPSSEQSFITDTKGNKIPTGEPTYYDSERNKITKEEYDRLYNEAEKKPKILLDPKARYIDYEDGYFGDRTLENVKALAEIAASNPDKIFFAAGGNPTGANEIPDITASRASLEANHLWPDNLIVVGYEYISDWVRMPASRGADIYIDGDFIKDRIHKDGSSSYATRIALEATRQNVKVGVENFTKRVKDFIKGKAINRSVGTKSGNINYEVLDFQKLTTPEK